MKPVSGVTLSFKCPKAIEELQPCNGNWYCDGCQKIVHDFRGVAEQDILNAFNQHAGNICGMFEADRVKVNPQPAKWKRWLSAAMLGLGVTGLSLAADAQTFDSIKTDQIKKDSLPLNGDEIFGIIGTSADFHGGTKELYRYLKAHILPDDTCLPGQKAFLTFTVETDGSLSNFKFIRSPFGKKMNSNIIRILKKSPPWVPATLKGRIIKQQYTLPITPRPIEGQSYY